MQSSKKNDGKITVLDHECTIDKRHEIKCKFAYKKKNYSTTANLAYYLDPNKPHDKKKGKTNAKPGEIDKMNEEFFGDKKKMNKWNTSFDQLFVHGGKTLIPSKIVSEK